MNIDYGNVQSNATFESRDDSPQIQDNPGHSTGLDPGGSDWPIYAKELLQTGKESPAPALLLLAR